MISSVAVEGIYMWDVERSGQVEGLLALTSSNQQFLSHNLYAGVVRQLQVVDAGHDWREEVVRVLRRLKSLSHNGQRWIQAPETWHTNIRMNEIKKLWWMSTNCRFSCRVWKLKLVLWSPPTGSLGLPVTNCRKSLCCSASKLLSTSNRNRMARLHKHDTKTTAFIFKL